MQKDNRTNGILTRFSLLRHPLYRDSSYSDFIGWSKPRIEVYEVIELRGDDAAEFANCRVQIANVDAEGIDLRYAELDASGSPKGAEKVRRLPLDTPLSTGHDERLMDASREHFVGCWTTRPKWIFYCLKVFAANQGQVMATGIRSKFTRRAINWYLTQIKMHLRGEYKKRR